MKKRDVMEISGTVEAPWGKFEFDGPLGFLQQTKAQLQFYLKTGHRSDTTHLKRDIEGYDMILKSKSQNNAHQFLKIKTEGLMGERSRFKDNIAVVEYLKKEGLWDEQKKKV